jgi:hypothetical protein
MDLHSDRIRPSAGSERRLTLSFVARLQMPPVALSNGPTIPRFEARLISKSGSLASAAKASLNLPCTVTSA